MGPRGELPRGRGAATSEVPGRRCAHQGPEGAQLGFRGERRERAQLGFRGGSRHVSHYAISGGVCVFYCKWERVGDFTRGGV